jgi:hypothetical protein
MACSRACTEVIDAEASRIVLSFLERNLSVRLKITLVSDDNDGQVTAQLQSQFLHPVRHFLEGVDVSDVVDDQGTYSMSNRVKTDKWLDDTYPEHSYSKLH